MSWPVTGMICGSLSVMVRIRALCTKVMISEESGGGGAGVAWRGWWEGSLRLPADVVSGALCLLNKRMWNINLPSPEHCVVCEVTHEAISVQLPFSVSCVVAKRRVAVLMASSSVLF